jgi:hypothetical protein
MCAWFGQVGKKGQHQDGLLPKRHLHGPQVRTQLHLHRAGQQRSRHLTDGTSNTVKVTK